MLEKPNNNFRPCWSFDQQAICTRLCLLVTRPTKANIDDWNLIDICLIVYWDYHLLKL